MDGIEYYKKNFFNTAIADIYRSLDGKSHIGAFVLTFCLIDYLTWLEIGHTENQKHHFCKWVKKRLAPLYFPYTSQAEELYSVRCALVHTYGPSKDIINKTFDGYELNVEHVGMHLQKVNNNILKLCLYSLLTDTIYAAHLFFEELKQNKSSEIVKRLNDQIKIIGINPPEYFKEMHRALSIFDNNDEISLDTIRGAYTVKILYA